MIVTDRMIFKNDSFKSAFTKMLQMDVKYDVAYKLTKLQNKLFDENKAIDAEAKALVEKYTKKDANGQAVVKLEKHGEKEVPVGFEWENEAEANEAFKELYSKEIKLELGKLFVHQLDGIKLNAAEWNAVDFIIADAPKE